jgi:hypothetical protein
VVVRLGRKRDSASKRLSQTIERHRKPRRNYVKELTDHLGLPSEPLPDWSDIVQRAAAANFALPLRKDPTDVAIKRSFEVFGLDPDNPHNWRTLLNHFAEAHFGRRNPGRPRQLNDFHQIKLLKDIALLKDQANTEPRPMSDLALSKLLRAKYPTTYGHIQPATIRKRIVEARKVARAWWRKK